MINVTVACAGFALMAFFEVHAIPLENRNAISFFADVSGDKTANLIVLDGLLLRIFEDARADAEQRIALQPGASAVDIADIDGDGLCEVVAVQGDRIVAYKTALGAPDVPQELFRLDTLYREMSAFSADAPGQPFITTLVIRRDGSTLLALPREDTLELRTTDGDLVESFPIGADAPRHVGYGRPFSSWTARPPQIASEDALEWHISRVLAFKPTFPEDIIPVEIMDPVYHRAAQRLLPETASLNPEAWPCFPLRKDGSRRERAFYALEGSEYRTTIIHVQRPVSGGPDRPDRELRVGPKRSYPGVILTEEEDLPDFNGDGYVDMVLWKTPSPAPTLDALTRALMGGKWPAWITTHLYLPEQGRFSPRPSGSIALEARLSWYPPGVPAAPVQHVVMRDMDGDGRADFGCSVTPRSFSVWRHTDLGFAEAPDFHHEFQTPITAVEARVDQDGRGRTSIVLRSEDYIYMLLAAASPDFAPPPPRDDRSIQDLAALDALLREENR
ncbi:MAG TPA: hypothetical protein ENN65_00405 [Candidatus Hydrogenedentes bacterium]|nr:hypothetical protein [Candidatus Hydrogenedentota bacterium]